MIRSLDPSLAPRMDSLPPLHCAFAERTFRSVAGFERALGSLPWHVGTVDQCDESDSRIWLARCEIMAGTK